MGDKPYFVILQCQNGGVAPLMDDDEIALFDTERDAFLCARENPLGAQFGFEIFELGTGNNY